VEVLVYIDAMVVLIRNIDPVLFINIHARRQPELPRSIAELPKKEEQPSFRIKNLNIVKGRIHHVDMPLSIHSDPLRLGEVAKGGTDRSEL
jgi:hypothetical protein